MPQALCSLIEIQTQIVADHCPHGTCVLKGTSETHKQIMTIERKWHLIKHGGIKEGVVQLISAVSVGGKPCWDWGRELMRWGGLCKNTRMTNIMLMWRAPEQCGTRGVSSLRQGEVDRIFIREWLRCHS